MTNLYVLHWGTVDLNIVVSGLDPSSGVIPASLGGGGTDAAEGGGKIKVATGSGGTKPISGSGGNG